MKLCIFWTCPFCNGGIEKITSVAKNISHEEIKELFMSELEVKYNENTCGWEEQK